MSAVDEVNDWLESIKLGRYQPVLKELGFNTMKSIIGFTGEKFVDILSKICNDKNDKFKEKFGFKWTYGDLGELSTAVTEKRNGK